MAIVERARDSGMPALSGRVALAIDSTRSQSGIAMRLALYRRDTFTPDVERRSDTVGRLGGDEFVVLIEESPRLADVAAVAQKILDAVARPFVLAAREYHIGASIGISISPEDGKDLQTLLKHADAAMYRAKEQGRNNYQFYAAQINVD